MLKKTIKYTDFNDAERTEDFYFNLTQAEIIEMETSHSGGMVTMLEKIIAEQDIPTLMIFFKDIIDKAYGEKTADGRRFIKNKEVLDNFKQTMAYSELYTSLATDAGQADAFVNGIMPKPVNQAPENKKEEALAKLKTFEQEKNK